MKDNDIPHDDVLIVQLSVSQIKTIIKSVLQETSLSSKNEQTKVLNIEEVSILTGYKKTTIYKLTHERRIPFHRPAHGGRRIFFKREEIIQWLQSNHIETRKEASESWKEKEFETKKKSKI